jgi:hypothetical protein
MSNEPMSAEHAAILSVGSEAAEMPGAMVDEMERCEACEVHTGLLGQSKRLGACRRGDAPHGQNHPKTPCHPLPARAHIRTRTRVHSTTARGK